MRDLFDLKSIEERLVDESKERLEASIETEQAAQAGIMTSKAHVVAAALDLVPEDPGAANMTFLAAGGLKIQIAAVRAQDRAVVSRTEATNVVPEHGRVWVEVRIPRRRLSPGPYVLSVTRDEPARELVHRAFRILERR
jgi:hypothetical protein